MRELHRTPNCHSKTGYGFQATGYLNRLIILAISTHLGIGAGVIKACLWHLYTIPKPMVARYAIYFGGTLWWLLWRKWAIQSPRCVSSPLRSTKRSKVAVWRSIPSTGDQWNYWLDQQPRCSRQPRPEPRNCKNLGSNLPNYTTQPDHFNGLVP